MNGANSIDLSQVMGAKEDLLGGEIAGLWTEWRAAASEAYDRWRETTRYVYATSTRETTNAQNDHSHSTHIPQITQIKDNLEANYFESLFPHDDWLSFKGFDRESVGIDRRTIIESYLKTKHDLSGFNTIIQRLISDWVLYGNVFAGVKYVSEKHPAADQGLIGYTGPRVYRISPFDIVFNPYATSFRDSPKIVRSLKTLAELQRDAEESPGLRYSQEVIDRVLNARAGLAMYKDSEIDKALGMEFEGFGSPSQYMKSGKVEILELYGDIWDKDTNTLLKNYVITVVDRMWVVRKQPLDTWSGRPHIFHCGWRTRPDNLWSMGPLDNLVGMQYMINHLENARADAFDAMLNPDRVFRGTVEDIQELNGALHYFVAENGNVGNLNPDTTVLNADFQIQQKQSQMEMAAGAPREAAGIRTPGEKTAFEVGQLMNNAAKVFQHKINYFSREFIEPIVEAELELARQNIDTIDVVEVVGGEDGLSLFLTITKEDIMANGKVRATGARHFARNNQLTANLAQFTAQLQSDPMLLQHFPSERLARVWEELLGFSNLDMRVPYGRVAEQAELQRLSQAAQNIVQEEAITPIDEGEYDELAEDRADSATLQ